MPQHNAAPPMAALILAAGRGTRMQSNTPKVLHEIAGRSLLECALALAEALNCKPRIAVISADTHKALGESHAGRAQFVLQKERRGTGDAARTGLAALQNFKGRVLIVNADSPLLRAESISQLAALQTKSQAPLALLSAPLQLPGFVQRSSAGAVTKVVERRDATPEQLAAQAAQPEGNAGVYIAEFNFLQQALQKLNSNNAQGELYLTQMVESAYQRGRPACALQLPAAAADEVLGVNTRAELAQAQAVQFRRNAARALAAGATLDSPDAVYIDTAAEIAADARIGPGVVISGASKIGCGAHVKAHSVIENAVLEEGAVAGPNAHLRPGAWLGPGARVGNFVEVKNSRLGAGVKADHLAYIGDADVGEGASFGCGAITVNYDWHEKHRTTVGARARIGCNANLIAPVTVEADAAVAAGATVTKRVPAFALALSAGRQRNLPGWRKQRGGGGE